jgi:hypothetical protein
MEQTTIATEIQKQHQDGVLWKGHYLWSRAKDPDTQAKALEEITAMLMRITNEPKRNAYTSLLAKDTKAKAKLAREKAKELHAKITKAEKELDPLQILLGPDHKEVKQLSNELDEWQHELKLIDEDPTEIKESELKAQIKAAVTKKKLEIEAAKTRAQFEKTIKSAADAGLPEDFEGSKEEIYNALQYGIYVHKGVYYSRGQKGGDYEISNFTMNILYHVQTGDEHAYRMVALKNRYGFECTIQMNTDDFVSLGSFKKVIARRGDYVFKGTESDLSRLQELLQKTEVATKFIDTVGWNKRGNFYAWGNGISPANPEHERFLPTDLHGMVEFNGKKYLIPACADLYVEKDDEYSMEKQFIYVPAPNKDIDWKWWSTLMVEVYNTRAISGILHYLCTINRDIIYRSLRKFPLLNLFGPKGTGKTEMATSLLYMFGTDSSAISLEGESTSKSYMRKIAQKTNAYVAMEEYKNNQVKHIGSLKNIYDGFGYDRAKMTNDNQTKQTPVRAAVMLIGQEMPTAEPALFSRVIMESFDGKERNPDAFQQLKRTEQFGLSFITAEMIQYRGLIDQQFAETQPVVMKDISVLLSTMHLLRDRVLLPFTYNEAKSHLIGNVMNQHNIMQGTDNVARWWGIVEQLHVQRLIVDGRDFELADSYLYIKIQNVHPLYTKEMISQRDANVLAKSTLEYYLKLDKSIYVDKKKKRFADGSNADCMQFVYNRLGIDLIRIFAENEYITPEQRAVRYEMKYREMGLDANGNPLPVSPSAKSPPTDDTPVTSPLQGGKGGQQTGFQFGDDDDPLSKDLL